MNNKINRLSATIIIIAVGILIVIILSYTGKESRGPIENLFSFASETVDKIENKFMISSREDKRSDKLKWFEPYFTNPGLLLKPDRILLGAFDNNNKENFESIIALEDSLNTVFPLIHIYTAWGDKAEQQFPAKQVKSIIELGSIPVITWEPWLSAFDQEKNPGLKRPEERDKNGFTDIEKGVYDFYLKKWAEDLKDIESPVFVRIGHEMNDPYRYPWGPQNNSAEEFKAGWKHIHDLFKNNNVSNVIWIWSPHPAYGYFNEFYPGDSLVDYVGIGTLNYGTVALWSEWWSFNEIFGNFYPQLSAFNKPIMLTEFGSLETGGDRSAWFSEALNSLPQNYPAVKSVLFFHFSDDKTISPKSLNWYFMYDTASTRSIRNAIESWK